MTKLALVLISVAVSTASIAQTPDARTRSRECQAKYAPVVPAGATLPKSVDPIRISPAKFEPPSAYACVTVTIDESGRILDSRVVETDYAPFGEHLLEQARNTKWRPAMLDGVPIALTSVVSASYGPSP